MGTRKSLGFALVAVAILSLPALAVPVSITDSMIVPTTGMEVQSGNGLLDLMLFLDAGGVGVAGNTEGSFNGDNANTDLPSGGGSTASESYITSFGDLRAFYNATFGVGNIDEIILCVDVNETGQVNFITMNTLNLTVDFTSPTTGGRDAPFANDILSATQNSTGSAIVGGTLIAALDGPKQLDLNDQGAGFADYFIFTGIDPFDPTYSNTTRIAFYTDLADMDNGGETIFISGTFSGGPPQETVVPEPATMILLGAGVLGMIVRRRSRKA